MRSHALKVVRNVEIKFVPISLLKSRLSQEIALLRDLASSDRLRSETSFLDNPEDHHAQKRFSTSARPTAKFPPTLLASLQLFSTTHK